VQDYESLRRRIRTCTLCTLSRTRTNAVPGEGSLSSKLMFIGEAPGSTEDLLGRPFVGQAGKLLESIIRETLGLERQEVYITNLVKCRPPNNREPRPEEIDSCNSYLLEEINIVKPAFIVTLGKHSTSFILGKIGVRVNSISQVRGKVFEWRTHSLIRVLPTYHPAAALYNPGLRGAIVEDLSKLKQIYNNPGIDKFLERSDPADRE